MVDVPTVSSQSETTRPTDLPTPIGARQTATGASPAAFGSQVADATANVAGVFGQASQATAEAALRLQQRENARERLVADQAFQTQAAQLYNSVIETQDLTDPAVGQKFNADLQALRETIMGGHRGGPDSAARLDNSMAEGQSAFSMKYVDAAHTAQNAAEDLAYTQMGADFYQRSFNQPGNAHLLRTEAVRKIEELAGPGLSPQDKARRIRFMEAQILEGQFQNMLNRGAWKAVGDIFRRNQDAAEILGPEKTASILNQAARLESGIDDKSTNVTVEIDQEAEEAWVVGGAELELENAKTVREKANAARDELLAIRDIETAINQVETGDGQGDVVFGIGQPIVQQAARVAEFIGIPQEQISNMGLGNPALAELVDKRMNDMIATRAQNGGRMTNMFLSVIRDSYPRLSMTEPGLRLAMNSLRRSAEYDIAEDNIYKKYLQARSIAPPDEPGLYAELSELEAQAQKEAFDLKKVMDEANASQPNTWQEWFQEAAGAAGDQTIPRETTAAVSGLVPVRYPGWSFGGYYENPETGLQHVVIINDGDPNFKRLAPGSVDEFLGTSVTPDETTELEADQGQEAPDDERTDPDPF